MCHKTKLNQSNLDFVFFVVLILFFWVFHTGMSWWFFLEVNWIHTFPKGIRAMWNAISLVQDLNSCRRVQTTLGLQELFCFTYSREHKRVHAFPKGI